ncbi:hypothetical protein NEUTE1DRAFT_107011 [Neurospora tetrasperma FGSC 2508]|uniref:Uncharacterized protein n=1 Tax=Neurospora tetrasperma (strain FGSC 2508 / ATCC MYA-4615 / P0657) TaxID=510951 RepID=F8MC21_NEUT8|nr:uncharacterized protein NEUTE1DRAFT_107011 [Neurospora tetrasperma FGSC 2508]EGO60375.1 hypothetical protein NEUTE1DRAFT_107011 [Neurospora tetrasperma FGSC 2508]EGZ75650.1 hypothetical protein NEUTE2DRAFT_136751 [Neurospora tetrasperma FGSC 2509]
MTGGMLVDGSLDFFNRWPSSLVTSGVKIASFRPGPSGPIFGKTEHDGRTDELQASVPTSNQRVLQLTGSHSSCPVDLPSSDLCGHCMGRSCRQGRLLTFEWAVRTSKKKRIRLSVQPKRREKRCGSNTGRLTRRPDLGVKVLANRKSSSLLMVVIDGSKWVWKGNASCAADAHSFSGRLPAESPKFEASIPAKTPIELQLQLGAMAAGRVVDDFHKCVRNAALMSDLISWSACLSGLHMRQFPYCHTSFFCTVSCSGCRPIARQGAQQMSLSPLGTGSTISLQNAVVLNVDHQGPHFIVPMVSVGSRLDNVMYQARSD